MTIITQCIHFPKYKKASPCQAFCYDTQSEMTPDDMEPCAEKRAPPARSQHQSRSWERKDSQGRSQSERIYTFTPKPNENTSQTDRKFKFKDYSAVRGGCIKFNSLRHDSLKCPFGRDDNNNKRMVDNDDRPGIQAVERVMDLTSSPGVDSSNRQMLLRHAQIMSQYKTTNGYHRMHA